MKHHGFFLRLPRLFTASLADPARPYDSLRFVESEGGDEDRLAPFVYPAEWGALAAGSLAEETAALRIPAAVRPVEENIVPSWLWRSRPAAGMQAWTCESDARQVFDRVAGSAASAGWGLKLFADEGAAHGFYDELRYVLARRIIALDPATAVRLGLAWRYGVKDEVAAAPEPAAVHAIGNKTIDALVSGSRDKAARADWAKILERRAGALRFEDIQQDWGAVTQAPFEAAVDLMALRHNDGTLNIAALRHAARLAMILLDLHQPEPAPVKIGFVNLAPLLMALAIPYDSDAGRAYAAAVAAIITAQAYAASAELAGRRGAAACFAASQAEREAVMRRLRNHRRAAHGESSDYEKISVLPAPLMLSACPDLALAAAAREGWDVALQNARQHGLRQTEVTGLDLSPRLALFAGAESVGVTPLPALTVLRMEEGETFTSAPHPAVAEGLARLGYTPRSSRVGALSAFAGTAPTLELRELYEADFIEKAVAPLPAKLAAIFATAATITPEARIRMAGAVQGLISGMTGLRLDLPEGIAVERLEKLVFDAWRRGVKDLRLDYVPAGADEAAAAAPKQAKRKAKTAAFLHGKAPDLPKRGLRLKAKGNKFSLSPARERGSKNLGLRSKP